MDSLTLHLDQRPIPPAALRDRNACELLRLWIAENGLHCSMRAGAAERGGAADPGDWGVVLAVAVRQLARALAGDDNAVDATIARMWDAMNRELGEPVPIDDPAPTRH